MNMGMSLMKEFGLWVLGASLLCLATKGCSQVTAQVPGFFIFGDSLVDNGNNNGLVTLARANYRPYGIDFPLGASGRFTNGRTFVDALG
ncbi:putative triacylglycerol lipase [Helianthus annuus]|nr:putative triacylglycerol lipase [Helianthus annuus]